MPTLPCPVPDCTFTWPAATPPEALVSLIDLHARTAHPQTHGTSPSTASQIAKAEKVKRPVVMAAGTSEEWAYFVQRWSDYKAATRLSGTDVIFQLLECCDEALRKDLTRTYGALTSSDETTVLANIKTLAVRQENVMVARVQLQQMMQDRDEPVRAYAARVRGHASICLFTAGCTQCNTEVDYSDIMVRDSIIRGLEDNDIRLDILSEANQNMSLEEVLKLVEAKESGKRSASRLLGTGNTTITAATSSSYRRSKQQQRGHTQNRSVPDTLCGYCGKRGHGQNRHERVSKCPAYNHTCAKCGILHHYEGVCRKTQRASPSSTTIQLTQDDATAVFDTLCTVKDAPSIDTCAITLDHHVYNELCEMWEKRASDPPPMISVRIHAHPADMKDLQLPSPISKPTRSAVFPAMADTGCQSCLAGTNLLRRLGLREHDLIPVSLKMTAANNKGIDMLARWSCGFPEIHQPENLCQRGR
jgi:hypothetical protein